MRPDLQAFIASQAKSDATFSTASKVFIDPLFLEQMFSFWPATSLSIWQRSLQEDIYAMEKYVQNTSCLTNSVRARGLESRWVYHFVLFHLTALHQATVLKPNCCCS